MIEFIEIPSVVLITYLTCEAYKWYYSDRLSEERIRNFIPILAGITGLLLGLTIYFGTDSLLLAENLHTACAIGITSGLSAVGIHEIRQVILNG